MAHKSYPRRYAQAVFEIALEARELDKWLADLEQIAGLVSNDDFTALVSSSRLSFNDKAKFLGEQLPDVNPLALKLLYLLIARGRLSMLGNIAGEYRRLLSGYRGIEEAEVLTAVPLSDRDKPDLEERLGSITGKKVVIKPAVDPELLGGIVARIGGKLLDGSTRSRLQALKKSLGSPGVKG